MPREMQTSMAAGELSPSLHSHADLQKFTTGLALCENWFVLAQGGVATRAGFEYINEAVNSAALTRLIPFQFNTEQGYALAFGHQTMRVIRNGAAVLEPDKAVTGATQANPVTMTAVAHGYSSGNDVFISAVGGMTAINGRFFRITVTSADTFTLDGVDGTGFSAYTGGGTAGRIFTLATPYLDADVFQLKYTQSADVITITHPSYPPYQLSRTDHHVWTLTGISFATSVSAPVGASVTQVGTPSGSHNKSYRYVLTTVSASGDESVASGIYGSGSVNALSATYGNRLTWPSVAGADYYNVYKEFSLNSGVFGFVGEVNGGGSPSFDDYNYGPDMSVTPPLASNPFSGAGNYPACVTYHQQRQWYGATINNPQTVWATRTGNFNNMDTSRPTRADDAIEATIAARQVNEVRHLLSLDDLIVFTSGGEWKAQADQDGVLTPANINFRTQGFSGAGHVPPLVIGATALFVQEKGARIRNLHYTFEDDRYTGDDLTVLARHLFEGYQIIDWCYAQEPYSIVWAVRDDGTLLSLTYLREHQVWAWTRHTTRGQFESVCSVSEGREDVVYAVVKRTIKGQTRRYIERMRERLFSDIQEAFCVDSGLTFRGAQYAISAATQANPCTLTATGHGLVDGEVVWLRDIAGMAALNDQQYVVRNPTANTFELESMNGQAVDSLAFDAYSSGGYAQLTTTMVSGLHHLAGQTLNALADGNVEEGLLVDDDGRVALSVPAAIVHLGLGYHCNLQTLELTLPSQQYGISQSRKKQVARVALRLLDGRGLAVGQGPDSLYEVKERTPAMGYANIPSQTVQQVMAFTPGWSDYGQTYVRQRYPLPATVLAIIPELAISG